MTEHLEEALCRLQSGEIDRLERQRAEAHLARCGRCREMWEGFHRLDSLLKPEIPDPPQFQRLLALREAAARRKRRAAVTFAALAVMQVLAGVVVLAIVAPRAPLIGGVIGGLLLGDSTFFVALIFLAAQERRGLLDAGRDWPRLARAWRSHLQTQLRAARWGIAASVLLVVNGLLFVGRSIFGESSALFTAIGTALLIVGFLGLVMHPRRGRQAKRELTSLAEHFPASRPPSSTE